MTDDPLCYVVPPSGDGDRVVDHVKEHLAVVATRECGPLIARGGVDHDGRIADINQHVSAGDVLTVDGGALVELVTERRTTPPADLGLTVAWEDDDLIVIDKPAGLHVHPMGRYRDDTILGGVLWLAGARPHRPWADYRPYPGHRLDRATSGLMVFLKHRTMQDAFRRMLDGRDVARTYHALVEGVVRDDAGRVDAPLGPDPDAHYRQAVVPEADGGKPAGTRWTVLERRDGRTLVQVALETGRTHQIRVHLASLGHPIVDDALYAADALEADERPASTAIALHAAELTFPHPRTGATITVTSPADLTGQFGR